MADPLLLGILTKLEASRNLPLENNYQAE